MAERKDLATYIENEMKALLEDVKANRPANIEKHLDVINSIRGYSYFNRELIRYQLETLGLKPTQVMSRTKWKALGYRPSRKFSGNGLGIFVLKTVRLTNSGVGLAWVNDNPLTRFCSKNGVASPVLANALGVGLKYLRRLQLGESDFISERLRDNYEKGKTSGILLQMANFFSAQYGTDDIDAVFAVWMANEPSGIQKQGFGAGEVWDIAQMEPIEPGKETRFAPPRSIPDDHKDLIDVFEKYAASIGVKMVEDGSVSSPDMYSYDPSNDTIKLHTANIGDDTGKLSAIISGLAFRSISTNSPGSSTAFNKERFKLLCRVEMANYVICRHLGVDNPYSPTYLSYMGTSVKELGSSLVAVAKVADCLVEGIEPFLVQNQVASVSVDAGLDTMEVLDSVNAAPSEEITSPAEESVGEMRPEQTAEQEPEPFDPFADDEPVPAKPESITAPEPVPAKPEKKIDDAPGGFDDGNDPDKVTAPKESEPAPEPEKVEKSEERFDDMPEFFDDGNDPDRVTVPKETEPEKAGDEGPGVGILPDSLFDLDFEDDYGSDPDKVTAPKEPEPEKAEKNEESFDDMDTPEFFEDSMMR